MKHNITNLHYNDLIPGKYYYGQWNKDRCIFIRSNDIDNTYGISSDNRLHKDLRWCSADMNILRPATAKEIAHLNACIKADRFVPESSILNPIIEYSIF